VGPLSTGVGAPAGPGERLRLATAWLGGCSGCHMSLLDLDERLLELAPRLTLVYSPFVDVKAFPEGVAATLVEGAVCSDAHLELARQIRARSRLVVAMGDCAVTGNVAALRNPLGSVRPVLDRVFRDLADLEPQLPGPPELPRLLDRVLPLHEVIPVDLFLPGCPPGADLLHAVLLDLLAGRLPDLQGKVRFG
jgi:NAD-reducing hydrogenase small subunit